LETLKTALKAQSSHNFRNYRFGYRLPKGVDLAKKPKAAKFYLPLPL